MKTFGLLFGLFGLIVVGYVGLYFFSNRNQNSQSQRQGDLLPTNVQVDSIDLLTNQLQPEMVIVVIQGVVGDSCSQLTEPVINRDGFVIIIELKAYKPDDIECSNLDKQPYSTDLKLDISQFEPGNYTVKSGDKQVDLVID